MNWSSVKYVVVSRLRPDRERILDVVQEGRISRLGVGWRAKLIVPKCSNSKHLAYMSLLKISMNIGAKDTKEWGLCKPQFDPLRSTSRLVKDGAETALFRKLRITHGREQFVYKIRVATGPESRYRPLCSTWLFLVTHTVINPYPANVDNMASFYQC